MQTVLPVLFDLTQSAATPFLQYGMQAVLPVLFDLTQSAATPFLQYGMQTVLPVLFDLTQSAATPFRNTLEKRIYAFGGRRIFPAATPSAGGLFSLLLTGNKAIFFISILFSVVNSISSSKKETITMVPKLYPSEAKRILLLLNSISKVTGEFIVIVGSANSGVAPDHFDAKKIIYENCFPLAHIELECSSV
jgi:hypothetical protein